MGGGRAEIAFEVADDLHGHGIATILLAHLAAAAQQRGIELEQTRAMPANNLILLLRRR
jgi:GNAT superfamily N-acetyltransferase